MATDMEFMNRLFHAALRRDLTRTIETLNADGHRTPRHRRALVDHLTLVLDLLHHHHTSEDKGLWPLARRRAPDLAAQLDMMESEHAAVAAAIDSTRAAAARYGADPAVPPDSLLTAVIQLRDTLLPHLDHEETEVMPRVTRALSSHDWSALSRQEMRDRGSLALAGTGLVWTVDGLDPERRSQFNRQVPGLIRWLIEKRYGRAYQRRAALAFDTVPTTPR